MKITALSTIAFALIACPNAQSTIVRPTTSLVRLHSSGDPEFVVQRISMGGKTQEDLDQGMEIASQGDQDAINQMMLEGKITFFAVGTQLYPVKSLGMLAQMWQVRRKGSADIWLTSIRTFMAQK